MIRLIEAPPGSGKTNWVMDQLVKAVDDGEYLDYYANIENIKILGVKPLPPNCNWISLNPEKDENFPKTLLVVDEAQYIDAFMSENKSKNNEIGKALSTHRHYGIDFWIITQSSKLLNNYVTLNVGEHVVIYRPRKKKKIRLYWFSTFQSTLSKDKFKNADDEQVYYLNPNMFELYKSTAVVTDNKVRKSTKLNSVLFSSFVTFLIIGFMVFNGVSSFSMLKGEEEVQTEEKQDTDDSQTSEPLLEQYPLEHQSEQPEPQLVQLQQPEPQSVQLQEPEPQPEPELELIQDYNFIVFGNNCGAYINSQRVNISSQDCFKLHQKGF